MAQVKSEDEAYNKMTDNGDTRECEAMRKMFVGGINRDTADEAFFDYFAGLYFLIFLETWKRNKEPQCRQACSTTLYEMLNEMMKSECTHNVHTANRIEKNNGC